MINFPWARWNKGGESTCRRGKCQGLQEAQVIRLPISPMRNGITSRMSSLLVDCWFVEMDTNIK